MATSVVGPERARASIQPVAFLLVTHIVLFVALWLASAPQGEAPDFSSYSKKLLGTRVYAELLRSLGFAPQRLTRPFEFVLPQLEGLLVIVEPDPRLSEDGMIRVFSPADIEALYDFVGRGNHVLMAAALQNELHDDLELRAPGAGATSSPLVVLAPTIVHPLVRGIDGLTMASRAGFAYDKDGESWEVPLIGPPDSPGVALVAHEGGAFILVADPWIVTNQAILDPDASLRDIERFLVNVAALHAGRRGEVYFDEVHHGYEGSQGVIHLMRKHGQHYALIQLALVFAVIVWHLGARFGRPLPATAPRPRDAVEHVAAVANLYRRARLRPEAVRVLFAALGRDLAHVLRLPPATPAAELIARLRTSQPELADRVAQLLGRALRIGRYTPVVELIAVAAAVQDLRAELSRSQHP